REIRDAIARDRYARGGTMSAESQQQMPRLIEPIVQIERRDGASRSLAHVAVERDEHGRTSELLDDARRHDPDHARVPPFRGEHDTVRFVEIELAHELACLYERGAVDFLAARVQLLHLARDDVCLVLACGEEPFDTVNGVTQSASGIEPRREDEPDAAGGERAVSQ